MNVSDRADFDPKQLARQATALLTAAGITADAAAGVRLHPLSGGRNNRTFRLQATSGDYLLKWYFSHRRDRRDRAGTEFAFCRCLWRHGMRRLPQPLGLDRAAGLALYSFLPGRPLRPADLTAAHHDEAVRFLCDANRLRSEPEALALGEASEACFSIERHIGTIGKRLQRLAAIHPTTEISAEMGRFVGGPLKDAFEHHCARLESEVRSTPLEMQDELVAADRILSPSDFGFHNALLQDDGSLMFVDFEYAGWDDPAKLVCDFYSQIDVPAQPSSFAPFLQRVAGLCAAADLTCRRVQLLLPLYRIKWCTIVLNDFLPDGEARRAFGDAGKATGRQRRQRRQLALASRMLERLDQEFE